MLYTSCVVRLQIMAHALQAAAAQPMPRQPTDMGDDVFQVRCSNTMNNGQQFTFHVVSVVPSPSAIQGMC